MTPLSRAVSIVLLAAGVMLVFMGLNVAVGFTPIGIVASIAAVATLLYSGAVWFGSAPVWRRNQHESVFVYDHALRVASGAHRGHSIASCVPSDMRADVEARCLAALNGAGTRFSCGTGLQQVDFDVVPVRSAEGMIVYGLLMTTEKSARSETNAAGA